MEERCVREAISSRCNTTIIRERDLSLVGRGKPESFRAFTDRKICVKSTTRLSDFAAKWHEFISICVIFCVIVATWQNGGKRPDLPVFSQTREFKLLNRNGKVPALGIFHFLPPAVIILAYMIFLHD